jgi:transcriptional regulator with XRE-family HTH domain
MAKDLKRQIGRQIAAARLARGYTQERLAELTERSVEAISNLERGKSFPSVETLESLSHHLGTPVRDFFNNGSGPLDRRAKLELKGRSLLHQLPDGFLEIAIDQLMALARHGGQPLRRRK